MKTDYGYFNIDSSGNENGSRIVVFVHGLPTGNFIWRNILPTFEDDYQVLAIELLGCGHSDKNPNLDFSIKAQANGIAQILQQFNKPIDIIGHDIGSGVIQRILVEYPNLINKTILINPIGYDYWPINVVKLWRTPIMSIILNAIFNKQFMAKVISDGVYYKDKCDENLLQLYTNNFNTSIDRQAVRKLMLALDSKYLMEISEGLKEIKNEVLLIRAKEDIYLTPEITQRLSIDIENSKLLEIERSGHFIHEDMPDELSTILYNFIKDSNIAN